MQYVDSSAWAKLYLREPTSAVARQLLAEDPSWVTAAHTEIEVRRIVALRLRGRGLAEAQRDFGRDWAVTGVVALDRVTCSLAAKIAEGLGVRTLDALHLAAAQRTALSGPFVTFDIRQAQAARQLGFNVVGV